MTDSAKPAETGNPTDATPSSPDSTAELNAGKLARRAQLSVIIGIGAICLSGAFNVYSTIALEHWRSSDVMLHLIVILAVLSASVGMTAIVVALCGRSRANTVNRSLAHTGLLLGLVSLVATFLTFLNSSEHFVPYLFAIF